MITRLTTFVINCGIRVLRQLDAVIIEHHRKATHAYVGKHRR